MPGEDLDDAIEAVKQLKREGFSTVLTHLGENISELSEAESVRDHYVRVLEQISAENLPSEISVKLTQLGLDISEESAFAYTSTLAKRAHELGNFVWIDIESTSYVDRTLLLYRRLRAEFPNVGLCLQSYLHRTENDLSSLLSLSPSIRLVKGAYREHPSLAFPKKRDVDRNYVELAMRLFGEWPSRVKRIGIGTHDMRIAEILRSGAEALRLPREAIEFQMLYGIGRENQTRLLKEGFRVRVLISYGSAWFPWYMRRLAERPANLWFVAKSVFAR
jgi:proline dehydrogenase